MIGWRICSGWWGITMSYEGIYLLQNNSKMPSGNNSKPSQTCEGWVVPNLTVKITSRNVRGLESKTVQIPTTFGLETTQ
jgi:hypothetical protein